MASTASIWVSPDLHYADLEAHHPRDILEWAHRTIEKLAIATSFQSSGLVLLHLLREIRPDIPVLFLETGFHFPETIEIRRRVAEMWDLNLVELTGEHASPERQEELYGPDLFRRDPDACCRINKVLPLQRALEGYDGWISGLRRDQSPRRGETPVVEAQMLPSGNEVLKLHPLARWTKADVQAYVAAHAIPANPLLDLGYASIGCAPCTRAVSPTEAERAGRWDGFDKTECGIHSFGLQNGSRQTEAEQ